MSALCRVVTSPVVGRSLTQAVAALVERVTGNAPSVSPTDAARLVRVSAPLSFPDGIGTGCIVVTLYAFDENTDLTLRLEHDRVFATPQRTPSQNRCFLNDYVASVAIDAEADELPETFVRHVVSGVSAARTAVDRHNRAHEAPWFRMIVAVREEATV